MLTDKAIKALLPRETAYKVTDGGQLYLFITPAGGKLWRLNCQVDGKQKTLSLGKYPEVSLKDARLKRDELRLQRSRGEDISKLARVNAPRAIEKEAVISDNSFERIAREWHKNQLNRWTEKHAKRIIDGFCSHIFPIFGQQDVATIASPQVLQCFRVLEAQQKFETAAKVYQSTRSVFSYAIAIGVCERNPANDIAAALTARPPTENRLALPLSMLHEFLNKLENYNSAVMQNMMMLLILTLSRPSEVRLMCWSEVDFNEKMWTIPAARMKMRKDHVVPLTPTMLRILHAQREVSPVPDGFVFVTESRGGAYSDAAFNKALAILGYKNVAQAHGFRSMASTALNECGLFRADVIEICLAHVPENRIRAVYNRAEYASERRALLEAWDRFLDEKKRNSDAKIAL